MIASFSKAIRLLSSDIEPSQLSLGICFGVVAGLSPLLTIQTIIVLLAVMLLRVNIAMLLLCMALLSVIAYLADPLIVSVGQMVLNQPALEALFTDMYNTGIWRFLNFNNTAAMGSLVISAIIFIPLFFISQILIKRYRHVIERHLQNSRWFRFLTKSKLVARAASLGE